MPQFSTALLTEEFDVRRRLAEFDLDQEGLKAVGNVARNWADDAGPLMPVNAAGTLAYIYGVQELRYRTVGQSWEVDRNYGIEAVVNTSLNMRVAYQNVDLACDPIFPPNPRSAKGNAAEYLSGPDLFVYAGVEPGPLTGLGHDNVETYYLMVGENGSVELSLPIIRNGSYKHFCERIFVHVSDRDLDVSSTLETGPVTEFDIPVALKDEE